MKILYIGFSRPDYSVDGVYIKGLKAHGIEVIEHFISEKKVSRLIKCVRAYLAVKDKIDWVIVGYASPLAVIAVWPFCQHRIIYNALCSEFERNIVSRKLASRISFKAYYYWLLDFLAVRCASLVMLESEHQIEYFKMLFKGGEKKYFRAWTGVDAEKFYYMPEIKKHQTFTVLFRGRLLPEAGAKYAVMAAKKLENEGVQFLMLVSGMELLNLQTLIGILKPQNLTLITEFLTIENVRRMMQGCHLSLGQLSAHERLERTIPHKAYESMALRLPYLTARNPAIMELLKEEETCLAFYPADVDDLVQKIIWAKDHPQELAQVGERAYRWYRMHATPDVLAYTLLRRLQEVKS